METQIKKKTSNVNDLKKDKYANIKRTDECQNELDRQRTRAKDEIKYSH